MAPVEGADRAKELGGSPGSETVLNDPNDPRSSMPRMVFRNFE